MDNGLEKNQENEKIEIQEMDNVSEVLPKYEGPEGLGGWLVLVCIGLVGSLILVIGRGSLTVARLCNGLWDTYSSLPADYALVLKFTVIYNLIFNVIIIVLCIILLFLFFKKKATFTRLIIFLYCINMAALVIDCIITAKINSFGYDNIKIGSSVYFSFIESILWIFYFNKSVRVKNTFVK